MAVIYLPGWEQPNEYSQRLKGASLQELIDAYNREVNITAWVSARARFLSALGAEFKSRSVDTSLIEGEGKGLTLAFNVAYDVEHNRLVTAT